VSETIAYRDLVFDLDLYPRTGVDPERVQYLKAVLEAGHELPPIVVDAETSRVIDGFHRARAYFGLFGATAEIPCQRRRYATQGERLLAAITLNADHGKPLDSEDHARCVALAEAQGVTVAQVASVLSVQEKRVAVRASVSTKPASGARYRPSATTGQRDNRGGRPGDTWEAPVGLAQINAVSAALQGGRIDVRDRRIESALTNLVRAAVERLKGRAA
jgi:hypothetical protein